MRAIDADALFEPNESTDKVLILGRNGGKTIALAEKMMRERVNMAPTLTLDDLRPKGRWEVIEDYVSSLGYTVIDGYRCSLCKEESREALDFCGHCGADMRGGGEDG